MKKNKHKLRKEMPVYSGVIKYFPDAIKQVAKLSYTGNLQHNPGQPLHWNREKSMDHYDSMMRHAIDSINEPLDDDKIPHKVKVAWRALAELQVDIEKNPQLYV